MIASLWRWLFPAPPTVSQMQRERAHWANTQPGFYIFPFPKGR